ncbi:hypothetical protein G6F46_015479 [Rhizopus delemar]|nr:hypothetical protein G6F46_015479 [Rhizopus delemar]
MAGRQPRAGGGGRGLCALGAGHVSACVGAAAPGRPAAGRERHGRHIGKFCLAHRHRGVGVKHPQRHAGLAVAGRVVGADGGGAGGPARAGVIPESARRMRGLRRFRPAASPRAGCRPRCIPR